ncbi:MAG: hypothetical protein LBH85_06485 [Treponema sp.]|jgi:hypothetical protein|nr:hypothetical protein [Treponema sp.]
MTRRRDGKLRGEQDRVINTAIGNYQYRVVSYPAIYVLIKNPSFRVE